MSVEYFSYYLVEFIVCLFTLFLLFGHIPNSKYTSIIALPYYFLLLFLIMVECYSEFSHTL